VVMFTLLVLWLSKAIRRNVERRGADAGDA
jgi:hypothetical protein